MQARRRGTGFCTVRCEDAQKTEDHASNESEAEDQALLNSFIFVADACDALVADDKTGGGMLICWLRDAGRELRGADLDAAEAAIDGAEGELVILREQIAALRRGEVL